MLVSKYPCGTLKCPFSHGAIKQNGAKHCIGLPTNLHNPCLFTTRLYALQTRYNLTDKEANNNHISFLTFVGIPCMTSLFFLKKMGQTRPLLIYFRPFLNTIIKTVQYLTINSVDGVLRTRTRGVRMVGADKFTEIWRHPMISLSLSLCFDRARMPTSQVKDFLISFKLRSIMN